MPDWEVTATTIYCEDVDDEVTLLVYGDGASICTGHHKYAWPDTATAGAVKKKSRQSGKKLGCSGAECHRIVQYRNKWLGI
jgi:hypothetical protein